MIEARYRSVSASEAGDYFQVLFEDDGEDSAAAYVLIQRQFEFPDGGRFYIESSDVRLCGNAAIASAVLAEHSLELHMTPTQGVRILFSTSRSNYAELARVLRIMFGRKLDCV